VFSGSVEKLGPRSVVLISGLDHTEANLQQWNRLFS